MVDAVILIAETLIDNIDMLIDAGIQLLIGLAEGLIEALPKLIDKIPVIIDKLLNAIIRNMPKIVNAGIELTIKLAQGLIQAIPHLVGAIPQIISSLVHALGSYFSTMISMGRDLVGRLKDGLMAGLGAIGNVGLHLVQGLWNGINNAKDWVLNKIKGFGQAILNGIKSFFGIHSPSTLFRDEIGENLALGIGEGFSDEMANVSKEMQNAIPTSFDTNVSTNGLAESNDQGGLVEAFMTALEDMKIELDGEQAGKFVRKTVSNAIFT